MTLARRNVLLGAGSAIGVFALPRPLSAPSVSIANADFGRTAFGLQPRDVVLLHSSDAEGWSFANAARSALAGARHWQKTTAAALGTDAGANHVSIKTALAAARGKRLLAFLSTQDELILNAELRSFGGVHFVNGSHNGAPGFSRHLIRASAKLANAAALLAASLHRGADDFIVRSTTAAATAPSASSAGGDASGMSIAASWPAALGSLLGNLAAGSPVTAQNTVMQRGPCTGRCVGQGQARASLLIDL